MNRYSKILHHVSPSNKVETPKSSLEKKRTFEEYEAEQKKTETDRLKEEVSELKKNIKFLENYIVQQHDTLFELKEHVQNQPKEKVDLQEGLLNEPPQTVTTDPLTPLDQNFITTEDLNKHYSLLVNRIQEQLATIGGGGETKLKYLDDIVGIATNASAYNGKFLKYDDSIKKFVFETAAGGGGSQDLNTTLGLGNTSNLGMSVGVITATRAVFTDSVSSGNPAIQITGIVTSDVTSYGLVEIGELNFTDSNIITSFTDDVDGYTQLIIQNKSDGVNASADIVVNNDRVDGAENYGSFGINGSNYDPVDAFGDPNGTYMYATGGTLTIGSIDNYDVKLVANNLRVIRLDKDTATPYFGTEDPTIALFNPIAVFTYDSPSYAQVQIQNISDGSAASVDYIASTDTATDASEYIDMGINGSGYETDGLWGPKDGYFYVQGPTSGPGGNLVIGTIDGGDIIFHTLSNAAEDERLRITNNGVGIGTTNVISKLTVDGTVTATAFVGDGSGLTGIIAAGSGVSVQDDGSTVGTASTINFGTGLSVSAISAGVVTVTSTSGGGESYWVSTTAGIHTISNVGVGTTNPTTKLQVAGVLGFGSNNNVKIGDNTTGVSITTGVENIFIGKQSGYASTSASYNNFIGSFSGTNTTSGNYNNFFGRNSGYYNTTGRANNFIGVDAGRRNTTGYYNNFFGADAGYYNTTGQINNFSGFRAGYNNTTGYYNNFFGPLAGYNNTVGSNNIYLGFRSGYFNTIGDFNCFLGHYSGYNNTTGNYNNFFGAHTGVSTTASFKTIIGRGTPSGFFDSPDTIKDTQFAVGLRTDGNGSKYWLVGNENFNIGIGTTNPTEKLTVGGNILVNDTTLQGSITATTSTTSPVGIHSALPIATYRSVEYTIQATEGSNFHATKILALHDGSIAYPTEYGTIYNNASVSGFNVDVSGGNIRLLATPASASTTNYTINFVATKI